MGSSNKIEDDVLFFDGVCNLCNGAVNFILDRDKYRMYRFSSLQSDYAKSVLPARFVKEENLRTLVLKTSDGKLFTKSSAALKIAVNLKGGWSLLYVFMILPKFIRDFCYDLIAKNRYRLFGRSDQCRIPTPELKERFLEAY